MTERIHDDPIDDEAILLWGYDEDLLFSEQDEDLLLGHEDYFPALAGLAKDSTCPKADYALSIIDFRLMFKTLYNSPDAPEQIKRAIQLLSGTSRPEIDAFLSANALRLNLLSGLGVVSRDLALQIGAAALNGVSRQAEITVTDNSSAWVVQLSVPPFHRHREWLTIEKQSGKFSFRR